MNFCCVLIKLWTYIMKLLLKLKVKLLGQYKFLHVRVDLLFQPYILKIMFLSLVFIRQSWWFRNLHRLSIKIRNFSLNALRDTHKWFSLTNTPTSHSLWINVNVNNRLFQMPTFLALFSWVGNPFVSFINYDLFSLRRSVFTKEYVFMT